MQFACFSWMDDETWKLFCSKIDEAYHTSHSTSSHCLCWCICWCIWGSIMVGGLMLNLDVRMMLAMIGSFVILFAILVCWSNKIERVSISETHDALSNVCSEQTSLFPGLLFLAKKERYFIPASSPDGLGRYAWRHYIQVQCMQV